MTLKTTWVDANQYTGLLLKLERKIEDCLGKGKVICHPRAIPIMVKTITFLWKACDQLPIAGVVITLMMIFLLADFRLGLWSMIPIFPTLAGLGVMGMLDLPLDAMSILVGSMRLDLLSTIPCTSCTTSVGINTFIRIYRWLWKKR
ncbi:MAG: hypothetical protein Ct9H300mP23_03050 [Nitrospinota bacterium]|nr:MAG: hypothetical protein Ct9H300mP23_03050 [Nitrospinota bacterium]